MIGNPVNESGYLLTGVNKDNSNNYTYRGVEILKEESIENLKQYVYEASGRQKGESDRGIDGAGL